MFTECHFSPNYFLYPFCFRSMKQCSTITYCQGIVKGAILCFKNLYFYFWNGKSTSTASPLTSPASQKSKDLNKVPLLQKTLPIVLGTWNSLKYIEDVGVSGRFIRLEVSDDDVSIDNCE